MCDPLAKLAICDVRLDLLSKVYAHLETPRVVIQFWRKFWTSARKGLLRLILTFSC
jgi:hypothetical protein